MIPHPATRRSLPVMKLELSTGLIKLAFCFVLSLLFLHVPWKKCKMKLVQTLALFEQFFSAISNNCSPEVLVVGSAVWKHWVFFFSSCAWHLKHTPSFATPLTETNTEKGMSTAEYTLCLVLIWYANITCPPPPPTLLSCESKHFVPTFSEGGGQDTLHLKLVAATQKDKNSLRGLSEENAAGSGLFWKHSVILVGVKHLFYFQDW